MTTAAAIVRRGQRLEYFTIAWNALEAVVSLAAGVAAGSVSLVSFGLDSLIELTSGAVLLFRLRRDAAVEQRTLRIVGGCFVALAVYVLCDSVLTLVRHEAPHLSFPGMVMAAVSMAVMPVLARSKRRVAAGIGSAAMKADAKQADFCAYLSAILLAGLLLNALLDWWWADPVAALVMVPIIAKEGFDGLRGQACACDCGH